jgi:hypothetical protein
MSGHTSIASHVSGPLKSRASSWRRCLNRQAPRPDDGMNRDNGSRAAEGRHAWDAVIINRAPVLTLWAAVVAERLGFDREEALTLGKSVAGLTAQSKGQRLGIFTPSPESVRRHRAEKARAAGVYHVSLL